jgi:glycerophosphoryl diester phosphodiesterase
MRKFINYAHRGASEYAPENTLLSFYTGIFMRANGIETDVQMTKDGVAVLFHDDTLLRVTGEKGKISDYTLNELKCFWVKKNELKDRIITLDEFFEKFKDYDITFAIELKGDKTALPTAELIKKHGVIDKVIATSFKYSELTDMHKALPNLRLGFLHQGKATNELLDKMKLDGINEICPEASVITKEECDKWHSLGFNVRAWGVTNTDVMKELCNAGVDGMTVNFPDKLTEFLESDNL